MNLTPLNYKLSLEPDLEKFSFNGFLELTLESAEKVESVNLNILELDLIVPVFSLHLVRTLF